MYDASTEELLHRAALYVLNMHNKNGYYCDGVKPPDLDFDPATVGAMPPTFKAAAEKAIQQHNRAVWAYTEEHDFFNDVGTALTEKDGALALDLLKSRNRHEYEGVEVEEIREAPVEW